MDITPRIPTGRKIITGYGGGGFKINHEFTSGSLLVFLDEVRPWDGDVTALPQLLAQQTEIELLLIGTGERTAQIDPATRTAFREKGIAVDVMDTGAACRTFNVLLAEERKVAAAVVAV